MEIKKSLLNAMLVGLTVGSISSCGMFDQIDEDTDPNKEIEEGQGEDLDQDILLTLLPLFAGSEIEAIEWSFDALYNRSQIPDWFYELLHAYSDNQCLVGHGIYFSVLSGEWKAYPRCSSMSSRLRKFSICLSPRRSRTPRRISYSTDRTG